MPVSERGDPRPGIRRAEDISFPGRQGSLMLRVAGDMKRNQDMLAEEIGVPIGTVETVLHGDAPSTVVDLVVRRMVDSYPVSRLGLEVVRDDTDGGVVVQYPDLALDSSRTFKRRDGRGELSDYYEYRDGAMSDLGPFRPEWIRELRYVPSERGDHPDIAYNEGHFLHQLTFYVGEVNLHYKDEQGKGHTVFTHTGDSNYGTPYVPHSFTTRDPNKEAYIMAVTFGGKLGVAVQGELSTLPPEGVRETLVDFSRRETAFGQLLAIRAEDSLMTPNSLTRLTGLTSARIQSLLRGEYPSQGELEALAGALGVNVRDLIPPDPHPQYEVVIQKGAEQGSREYPSEDPTYLIKSLAGSTKVSETKGFSMTVTSDSIPESRRHLDLSTPMHTYGYNYGTEPAVLFWDDGQDVRQAAIEPGASFYAKPKTRHALRGVDPKTSPELMLARVGGALSGDSFIELSHLPPHQMERLLNETGLWYKT